MLELRVIIIVRKLGVVRLSHRYFDRLFPLRWLGMPGDPAIPFENDRIITQLFRLATASTSRFLLVALLAAPFAPDTAMVRTEGHGSRTSAGE